MAAVPPSAAPAAKVILASHQTPSAAAPPLPPPTAATELLASPTVSLNESLVDLEAWTLANNPTLRRMRHEAGAAFARANYVAKLRIRPWVAPCSCRR